MERDEAKAALKSSFFSELAMISTQQVSFDDVRCLAAGVTCDDFSVDDLFDFSDKYFEDGVFSQESEEDEAKDPSSPLSSHQQLFNNDNDNNNEKEEEFETFPEGELAVPVDDVENLEWLSQIVDDSRSDEISLLFPVGGIMGKTGSSLENQCEPAVQRIREPCFPLPASGKSRRRRSRLNGKFVWTLGSPSLTPGSSSATSYSSHGSSTISPSLAFAVPVEEAEFFSSVEKPPKKKQSKKPAAVGSQLLRRCTHCQVQRTPQWRTGPLGPKTLCNACGVRYKSDRLFPEYRPACSPTFSSEIHSNSHRKVLEMRRMKEIGGAPETGLAPMLQGF